MENFGAAWAMMGVAFGFHVVDEAATDFLASYSQADSLSARGSPLPSGVHVLALVSRSPRGHGDSTRSNAVGLRARCVAGPCRHRVFSDQHRQWVAAYRGCDTSETQGPRRDQRPFPLGGRGLAPLCSSSHEMQSANAGPD